MAYWQSSRSLEHRRKPVKPPCAPPPPYAPAWRISTRRGQAKVCRRSLWRRAAFRRYALGQHRRCRPAGLHRHRPRRQPRQPAGGPLQAARTQYPCFGVGRSRDNDAASGLGESRTAGIAEACAVFTLARNSVGEAGSSVRASFVE